MKLDDKHEIQLFVIDLSNETFHIDYMKFRKENPESSYHYVHRLINTETGEVPANCSDYYDEINDAICDYRNIVVPRTITFNDSNSIKTMRNNFLTSINEKTIEVATEVVTEVATCIDENRYIVFKCNTVSECYRLASQMETERHLDLTKMPCRWATGEEVENPHDWR